MIVTMPEEILCTIREYRLPRFKDIPNVGLYLDQVVKYLNEYLSLYPEMEVTGSMVSNYVKKHLIANPVKKLYQREQIAYLMFIALAKTVVSLDHVRMLIAMQQETYEVAVAYDYACDEFERALKRAFFRTQPPTACEDTPPEGAKNLEEKFLLHQIACTAANKVYLEKSFQVLETASQGQ
ncbi:MAG: DUF1836 domain-containing protein [Lachnospiraceae bacterium]|nr:DUF1836 domain-containing protein [Lachnospiraceae bacterium]